MDQPTVILVPGFFGTALSCFHGAGKQPSKIWPNTTALMDGQFARLAFPEYPGININAHGILEYYDIIGFSLRNTGFKVLHFPYDWRKDVEFSAVGLKTLIAKSVEPVIIVSHSLGSIVARKAIQLLAAQHGPDKLSSFVSKLIMLGPSVHGTLAAALGLMAAANRLPPFDILPPMPAYVQPIMAKFPSLYQALPWNPAKLPSLDDPDHNVRSASFWRGFVDVDALLTMLPPSGTPWAAIDTSYFVSRTSIILGDSPQTAGGLIFRNGQITVDEQYNVAGDGFVPRVCSLMDERPVTYIASGISHLQLPLCNDVINCVLDICSGKIPTSLARFY